MKIGQHFDKFMNEQLFTFVESMCNRTPKAKKFNFNAKNVWGQNPGPKPSSKSALSKQMILTPKMKGFRI